MLPVDRVLAGFRGARLVCRVVDALEGTAICGATRNAQVRREERETPKHAVERPARLYKSDIQNRFTVGNAKGA